MSATDAGTALLNEPHHDGSDTCVLEKPKRLGDDAVVRVHVPESFGPEQVVLRYVRDGEPRHAEATAEDTTADGVWWRASFPVWNPSARYRWLLAGGAVGYAWLNALGLHAHQVPDADDFVMTLGDGGPDWHLSSVVYQVFPDRFATSGLEVEPPEWAVRRPWDAPPTGRGRHTPHELYGGDLRGLAARLDHVEELGANAIYLTPFFPAGSTHRYDATTFDHVDPLLGGDVALVALAESAHARGIRLIGDITLNHTGVGHEWFRAARADERARERRFYFFDPSIPGGYESWLGHRTLPKLNWRSDELRRRFAVVLRRYLHLGLDGWRIDVANMTGRYHDDDLNHDVAGWARDVVGPRTLLIAEHGHDFRPDLAAGASAGWNGTMNYSGFLAPAWTWLRRDDPHAEQQRWFWGVPAALPSLPGDAAMDALRRFRAGVPFEAMLHSWNLLDSHDTARFRTIAGTPERHLVGIGMQMTLPGVPMLFAGDELGVEGAWGEDARRTIPWDAPRDEDFFAAVQRLVRLRRSSDALARGGLRFVHVGADAIAYVRESREERLLCLAARARHAPLPNPFDRLETLVGHDASTTLPADGPAFHVWRVS
jgi:alpha-glucosidase